MFCCWSRSLYRNSKAFHYGVWGILVSLRQLVVTTIKCSKEVSDVKLKSYLMLPKKIQLLLSDKGHWWPCCLQRTRIHCAELRPISVPESYIWWFKSQFSLIVFRIVKVVKTTTLLLSCFNIKLTHCDITAALLGIKGQIALEIIWMDNWK